MGWPSLRLDERSAWLLVDPKLAVTTSSPLHPAPVNADACRSGLISLADDVGGKSLG